MSSNVLFVFITIILSCIKIAAETCLFYFANEMKINSTDTDVRTTISEHVYQEGYLNMKPFLGKIKGGAVLFTVLTRSLGDILII